MIVRALWFAMLVIVTGPTPAHAGTALDATWQVTPGPSNGQGVQQDGEHFVLTAPAPTGKQLFVCSKDRVSVKNGAVYQMTWKTEGIKGSQTWHGARALVQYYGTDGKLLEGKARHEVLKTRKGSRDWDVIDVLVSPSKGATHASACVQLINTTEGTVRATPPRLRPIDASGPGQGKNVLVIVIDTLRAEALGVHGNKRAVSPQIDKLGNQSILFDRGWTQFTWTVPSTISLFTSQYARTHQWDGTAQAVAKGNYQEMSSDPPTLAQVLRAEGYLNTGYVGNSLLKSGIGVNRGFQTWKGGHDAKLANMAIADIGRWDNDGAPNFLYLHLMAPHAPLDPSPEGIATAKLDFPIPEGGFSGSDTPPEGMSRDVYLSRYHDAYHACVFDADKIIGRVLATLESAGHADDTIVVLTSDHGELLGEHDLIGHGSYVWEQLSWVPLMYRVPGHRAKRVQGRIGQSIDVAPTILDYVDLKAKSPSAWQGISILGGAPTRLGVVERASLIAFSHDGKMKILERRGSGELLGTYDLSTGLIENHDLGPSADSTTLQAAGKAWRDETPVGQELIVPERSTEEQEDMLEALKALGYVE